jgi:Ca2+-transporting ATPase
VDKAGTLTLNRMAVRELRVGDGVHVVGSGASLPAAFHEITEFAALASPADSHDPIDAAFTALAREALSATQHAHPA